MSNLALDQQTNPELMRWQLDVIDRLARIEEHTKQVVTIDSRVDSLEASRDKQKGITTTLGTMWIGLCAVVGWHISRGH